MGWDICKLVSKDASCGVRYGWLDGFVAKRERERERERETRILNNPKRLLVAPKEIKVEKKAAC